MDDLEKYIEKRKSQNKDFAENFDKGYEDFVNYMVNYHYISPNSSPDVFLTMKKDNFAMYNRVIKNKIS